MTESSRYLATLARQAAAALVAQTHPRAILLTGSVAEGVSDRNSDIDLIAYYEALPSSDQIDTVRAFLMAADFLMLSGEAKDPESFLEQFALNGVTCQVAHLTIAAWERDLASVLDTFEPGTLVEKAIMGLQVGMALHGRDLITGWQARAAEYPDALARATVEHYLTFFPLWLAAEWWRTRDASIFYHQMLVEASLNLLGVLAGLNRLYFSSFQFKRLHQFVGRMRWVPERLAERLDNLFTFDPAEAGLEVERLVAETVALVDAHMPAVDTSAARRYLGVRQRPWTPSAGPIKTPRSGPGAGRR